VNPEINDAYEVLYNEYAQRMPEEESELVKESELVDRIRTLIDRVADSLDLSEKLRPDAKLYLLINYHNLLVMPLIRRGSMREDILFDALEQDAKSALRRAKKQADWNDENTISGHRMLSAISDVWNRSLLLGGDVRGLSALSADPVNRPW